MAFLSSFYPQPVVKGTTAGTYAEGNDSRFGDGLEEAPEDGVIYGRKDADWVDITEPANLQVRRGTAAEVNAITPLVGEPVWETDTKKLKVGDGIVLGGVNVGKFPLDGTLRNASNPSVPLAGSVFVSDEVDNRGGVGAGLGRPYVAGNTRGAGAVDLQPQRSTASQVASGSLSFIAASQRSTASGSNSSVVSSTLTTCSGSFSLAVGCTGKTISGTNSFSINSNITKNFSVAFNGVSDRTGMLSHGTFNNVVGFGPSERVQAIQLILKGRTTSESSVNLILDSQGGIDEFFVIPSDLAVFGTIEICAIQESTGTEAAHYIRKFGIKNVSGTTELIGSITDVGTDYESSAGLGVTITADNGLDVLNISVNGIASTTIRWVAIVKATEVEIA